MITLNDVTFTANGGEILGIAGIAGCGQKELLEAIAGLQPVESGEHRLLPARGQTATEELIGKDPPWRSADMGVTLSFVPEDRLGMGLVGNMDLADNMMLRSFRKGRASSPTARPPQDAGRARRRGAGGRHARASPRRCASLSGGNVQKVLVGREIASAPTVLLTAYAVRGLDINSSYTIYDLLNEQKKTRRGRASTWARIWTCCWSCATGSWCSAAARSAASWTRRTATKDEVGLMMTRAGREDESR